MSATVEGAVAAASAVSPAGTAAWAEGITVSGGAGGVAAHVEELDGLALVLDRVAAAVVRAEIARADVVRAVAAHHGSAPALAELAGLGGPRGLHATVTAADLLASGLRRSAAGYLRAETDTTARLRALAVATGEAWGESGPVGWWLGLSAAAGAAGVLATLRALRWTPSPSGAVLRWLGSDVAQRPGTWGALGRLFAGPGLLPALPQPGRTSADAAAAGLGAFVVGALPGRLPVPADPAAAGARTLAAALHLVTPGSGLVVTAAGRSSDPPPADEADLLGLVADQYEASTEDAGQVAVQRLEHADGSVSWVVAIPGTQTGEPGGPNPFDPVSDLELAARVEADVTELVLRAMAAAGVGADEPVLLAGHSLGGMVAMAVAAEGGYQVAAVLTAGSPVAGVALPAGTAALHLEHAQDPVPGLAGAANPDTVQRTTVVRDLAVEGAGTVGGGTAGAPPAPGVAQAHALAAYRRTAELLPGSDPSIRGFRQAMDAVLGHDVVAATTYTFTGERVPDR